jgi:hypothetical protein
MIEEVVEAAGTAAADIIEAGATGGIAGAESAAVSELAKAAGEVAEFVVDKIEGKPSIVDKLIVHVSMPTPTLDLIVKWAHDRNIINGSTAKDQFLKFISEVGEFSDAISKKDQAGIVDGLGDAAVVLTIIAEQCGTTLQACIDAAYSEIKDRQGIMFNGVFVKSDDARYSDIVKTVASAKNDV